MYAYDQYDQAMVDARVAEFRDQCERRLAGKLSEDQFKPLRLMNGLYLQLHAYMLRVAIPYGTLNGAQMDQLALLAEKWDKGYGHFTTRQNIQYNWPELRDVPDMLDALAKVNLHAIQTSGNTIRNVTADHFAGAAADEVADPRDARAEPAVGGGAVRDAGAGRADRLHRVVVEVHGVGEPHVGPGPAQVGDVLGGGGTD